LEKIDKHLFLQGKSPAYPFRHHAFEQQDKLLARQFSPAAEAT
jgi:hypothetical protein